MSGVEYGEYFAAEGWGYEYAVFIDDDTIDAVEVVAELVVVMQC